MARASEQRRWKSMLVELMLIFLGISGAFTVERWNEARLDAGRERVILDQMVGELQVDTADLNGNLRANAIARAARDSVLAWLDGSQPFDSTTDSLFAASLRLTNFISNSSAYETFKSLGLDLVSDNSLRFEITRYYETGYGAVYATQALFVNEPWTRQLQPRMMEHFEVAFWRRVGPPQSDAALRSDKPLRAAIASFSEMGLFADAASRQAVERAGVLMEHIEQYLGRR